MEERLALVVSSVEELAVRLSHYTKNPSDKKQAVGGQIYQGNVKADRLTATLLNDGKTGKAIVQTVMENRDLDSLAQMWVSGVDVEWILLYPNYMPRRISLPTYPFAKERYWLADTMVKAATNREPAVPQPGEDDTIPAGKQSVCYSRPIWQSAVIGEVAGEQTHDISLVLVGAEQPIIDTIAAAFEEAHILVLGAGSTPDMGATVNNDVQQLWRYLEGLLKVKPTAHRRIIVLATASDSCRTASLMGFLKSAQREHPNVRSKAVTIPELNTNHLSTSDVCTILRQEIADATFVTAEVEYDQLGGRAIKTFVTLEPKRLHEAPSQVGETWLKADGVYWITGGMGGLGRIFAHYMMAQGTRITLILSGRTLVDDAALDEIRQQAVAEMNQIVGQNAGKVIYLPCDVIQREDVTGVVQTIRQQYGGLHGIIHSAGTINDSLLLNKSAQNIEAVLAPKIVGILNIDAVTQDEPLDFMVLFSSLTGVMGNIGQADYGAANAFLDSFAAYRQALVGAGQRSGQTVSINWPLWESGGMQVDEAAQTRMMKRTGLMALTTAEGLQAFHDALAADVSQVMVTVGDMDKLNRVEISRSSWRQRGAEQASQNERVLESELLQRGLLWDLKQEVSAITKISIEQLDENENLGGFGFDSISLKQLAIRLEDRYEIELTPTIFFEYSDLLGLAKFLLAEHRKTMWATYQTKIEEAMAFSPAFSSKVPVVARPLASHPASTTEPASASATRTFQEVAIIGIGGMMPQSPDLETFWQHIANGDDLITEIPTERWDWQSTYDPSGQDPQRSASKWGGFIPDVDKFDPAFFKISPREAAMMDPQHRLFLQMAWRAIEDAGYRASDLAGRSAGVYVGVQFQEYQELLSRTLREGDAQVATGNAHSMLANRVSFLLDLHGPSEAIDTACSSALVALHRAVQSLRCGEVESAIVGGVSLALSPTTYVATSQMGVLSPDGRCKTFDKHANGYVKGEGVGAVLLKPLAQAQADGDHVYAIIRGSAENHGGRATSLTAPNAQAQARLLVKAYEDAGVDIGTVGYIETHGTATELGDPVEIEGLKRGFQQLRARQGQTTSPQHYCGLGSVKTNVGHLEPAAGMAGLFKTLLAMKHQTLPATIHFQEQNPYIDLADSPFYLVTKTEKWRSFTDKAGQPIPRRAGVSSFGFGGTNAHVVLEEYIGKESGAPMGSSEEGLKNEPQLVVLSARNEERLREYARKLLVYLAQASASNLSVPNSDAAVDTQTLQHALREMVAEIVGVDVAEIECGQTFAECGLDVVQLSRLQTMLEERYRCELPATLSTTEDSTESVARHLSSLASVIPDSDHKAQSLLHASSLANIAYTLQIGRETMESRLAFVAHSVTELAQKLTAYLENKIGSVYHGHQKSHGKANRARFDLLTEGEEAKVFIATLIQNGKLESVAQAWVSGVEIDWALFYGEEKPSRISLPTYPFAQERYWIPDIANGMSQRNTLQSGRAVNVGYTRQKQVLEPDYSAVIAEALQKIASDPGILLADEQAIRQEQAGFEALEKFALITLLQLFQQMGVLHKAGERYHEQALRQRLKFLPKYEGLYQAFLLLLEQAGYITRAKDEVTTTVRVVQSETQDTLQTRLLQQQQRLQETYPTLRPYFTLLDACTQSLSQIAQGQVLATEILFPNGSLALVEGIYRGAVLADYFSRLSGQAVKSYIEQRLPFLVKDEVIRIVEIGAGTGSTTGFVLEAIEPYGEHIEYLYTDISAGFTDYGRGRFGARYPFMKFGLLDIEKDLMGQGDKTKRPDIILGANVVHATKNIRHTLKNLNSYLAANGLLVLNEATYFSVFGCLTAALLDGWWLFEDEEDRLKHSPLLSTDQWQHVLEAEGFNGIRTFSLTSLNPDEQKQSVIIAQNGGAEAHARQEGSLEMAAANSSSGPVRSNHACSDKPAGEIASYIKEKILEQVALATGVSPGQIDLERSLAEYGVDSLTGSKLVNGLNQTFGIQLQTIAILGHPDIASLIQYIYQEYSSEIEPPSTPRHASQNGPLILNEPRVVGQIDTQTTDKPTNHSLVPIRSTGTRAPFFCVHPWAGVVYPYYELAAELGPEQPFYGLQAVGLYQEPHTSIEQMATHYLDALRQVQPVGPYLLGGWSMGGLIAYEMAQQLQQIGETVALLALLDVPAPIYAQRVSRTASAKFLATDAAPYIWPFVRDYLQLSASYQGISSAPNTPTNGAQPSYLPTGWQMAKAVTKELYSLTSTQSSARRISKILNVGLQAISNYDPQPYPGQVTLFRVQQQLVPDDPSQTLGWHQLAEQGVAVHQVPGRHLSMIQRPHVEVLAQKLQTGLEQIELR